MFDRTTARKFIAPNTLSSQSDTRCHFDQREKSFLDPSHSLGMTGPGARHLGVLCALCARHSLIRCSLHLKISNMFGYVPIFRDELAQRWPRTIRPNISIAHRRQIRLSDFGQHRAEPLAFELLIQISRARIIRRERGQLLRIATRRGDLARVAVHGRQRIE